MRMNPLQTYMLMEGCFLYGSLIVHPCSFRYTFSMTIRLDGSVVRGELDNRIPGRVSGLLWLNGLVKPVELELKGDAMRDLAGHRITFSRREPPPAVVDDLQMRQTGRAGRITASDKCRVPDCSDVELFLRFQAYSAYPWRTEPVLMLEWVGDQDGHVVLVETGFEVTVEGAAAWTMSEAREDAQRKELMELAREVNDARMLERIPEIDFPTEDRDLPMAEQIADREDARMEQLMDRIQMRMNQLGDVDPETYEQIYEEEREKLRSEWGEPEPEPPTPEQAEARERRIEEFNEAAERALEEMENGEWEEPVQHPLAEECTELGFKISQDLQDSGWVSSDFYNEHPLQELLYGIQCASAKLSGGLDSLDGEWPPPRYAIGHLLVRLKKAREHLRDALRGLDAADEENLAVPAWRQVVRNEVDDILSDVIRLIDDVRSLA
jgi:hypothetical protein